MKIIFLEKSFAKYDAETSLGPFLKIKIEHISNNLMINGVRFYTVFLMYAKLRAIETY